MFTDVEGSTRLWERNATMMRAAMREHDAILRSAVESNHGQIVKTTGDGAYAAFTSAVHALTAALTAQRRMNGGDLHGVSIRSRMALNSGSAEPQDGDYYGPLLNRAARIMAAGYGGQILVAASTAKILQDCLPVDVALRDLGQRRLRDLIDPEHLFEVVADGVLANLPPLRTLDARPNNLPMQSTALVGRVAQLADIRAKLSRTDVRLVTLTGTGGAGKTRLACQVAAEMLDEFEHGVFFVALASVSDAPIVMPTVANAFGVRESVGQSFTQHLHEHLRDKEMLIVLDNFEQVVAAAPELVELLNGAPRLKFLVTSREPLRIRAEMEHPVPPLSLPANDISTPEELLKTEGVKLFMERAVAVQPSFRLTRANASALASICRRLDGLPLAIELAAARVRVFTPEAILRALDHRLRFLNDGPRDAPSRQRTLRGAIGWSHDLLNPQERMVFRRLGVLAGTSDIETIEAVCNAGDGIPIVEILESLVLKNLVRQSAIDREPRFSMLETVREFAQEQLAATSEDLAVRRRQAAYFLTLIELGSQLRGGAVDEWLARLDVDQENIRAVLGWSANNDVSDTGIRLCARMYRFWYRRGHFVEGRDWCDRVLKAVHGAKPTPAIAEVLRTQGVLAYAQADYAAARELHEQCLAIRRDLGDRSGIAVSLNDLGNVAQYQGDYVTARVRFEESLAIKRALGQRHRVAATLANLGTIALDHGDTHTARARFEEALRFYREEEASTDIAIVLINLGPLAELEGDLDAAEAALDEALAITRGLGERPLMAGALANLGSVAIARSDPSGACALYRECLALSNEVRDFRLVATALEGIAESALQLGDALRAARLWGAAEKLRESIGSPLTPTERDDMRDVVSNARGSTEPAAFHAAWSDGRAATLHQSIEYAMS